MTADLQSAVQRALSAWDTTTLKTNGDGMLSEAMESLRIEFDSSVQAPAEGDAPFAWATFDGEGGFDLCLYDGNESHRDDYIKCNGPQFMSWVTPLYASKVQPKGNAAQQVAAYVPRSSLDWLIAAPADKNPQVQCALTKAPVDSQSVALYIGQVQAPAPGAEQEQTTDSPEYLKSMGAWLGAVGDLFIAMGRPDIPGDTPVDSIAEIIREAAKRLAVQASAVKPGLLEAATEAAGVLTFAARDVLLERERQITAEGWTSEHDDAHDSGDLAAAGAAYAIEANALLEGMVPSETREPPFCWPWAREWWKSKDARRNLVKAGALILAEIERLDRSSDVPVQGSQP